MSSVDADLARVLHRLERWGDEQDWVGPDPYEGLNSSLGRVAGSKRSRQAVVQAYKRLPISPTWPLRVMPAANSKALALALSGYAAPGGSELQGAERNLASLPARVASLRSADVAAWGYHFDTQTRHLFYGRDSANAIATCFVIGALVDVADATGDSAPAELALQARPYLLSLAKELPGGGSFFAYVADGSELIHNANLLVCAALARLHELEPDPAAEAAVQAAAATTLGAQRPDGLWPYGESKGLEWVDNFHTAYVLEAICELDAVFGLGREALDRGLPAWRAALFEADGWARYYPEHHYPLEPHSCASAIDFVWTLLRRDPKRADRADLVAFARRVASTAVRELWLEDPGCFGFRRGARGLNRRRFMRWTNAPMFRALVRLASLEGG